MSKITFIAFWYVFALLGLFLGGSALFLKIQFVLGSEDAQMASSDPALARALKYLPNTPLAADVVYETAHGSVPVKNKFLSAQDVERLARGEKIPIRYLKSDPQRALAPGTSPSAHAGWLAVGLIALGVAVFAHRLLRKESGVSNRSR